MFITLYAKYIHITFMRKSYNQYVPQNFVTNKSEGKKLCK